MKKIGLVIVLMLSVLILGANNIICKTLLNGMEVVVKEDTSNESVGLFCFVKTGSVNEADYLGAGISHYLEHIVSSGTTSLHTEKEYKQIGKKMGAIVNAYTSYGVTAFHLITDKSYSDMALEILAEQMQFCVCDSSEVAREKEVILKEIVMRSTPVNSKIRQKWRELIFPNSNRKYPVIGYTNLFKTITRDELEDYYQKRYAPNNMIFVAVGDFEAEVMIEKIEKAFENFERQQLHPVYLPTQNARGGTLNYIEEFDVQQASVFMTSILPSSEYESYFKLNVALDILFGKRQAPIKYKLVEELKLVNDINAYVDASPNNPEGIINITFEAKRTEDINKIIEIIDTELAAYAVKGFKQSQIDNIINRIKAHRLLFSPDINKQCNDIGWLMLKYGVPDYDEIALEKYANLTVSDLENGIKDYLLPKDRVVFSAVPRGEKAKTTSKSNIEITRSEPKKIQIKKDLTLIHKYNNEKPLIRCVINIGNSTDYETIENVGTINFMTKLMFMGSGKYDSLSLTEWLEDHVVDIEITSSSMGTFIEFKCLKADYETITNMIFDAMNNPIFSQNEIDLAKERAQANYDRGISSPETQHRDFRNATLYGNTKYGVPAKQGLENILKLDQDKLFEIHKKYFNADKAIITFFGDFTEEEAIEKAKEIQAEIPSAKIKEKKHILKFLVENSTKINEYSFEQVNIDINLPAPKIDEEDYY
ncbi:MAG: insulinase family protein, partial [Candidatus Cloacimonetes bacterium]|nr:insulinase family protein [Candidatus Cloacimonadota bacterium]